MNFFSKLTRFFKPRQLTLFLYTDLFLFLAFLMVVTIVLYPLRVKSQTDVINDCQSLEVEESSEKFNNYLPKIQTPCVSKNLSKSGQDSANFNFLYHLPYDDELSGFFELKLSAVDGKNPKDYFFVDTILDTKRQGWKAKTIIPLVTTSINKEAVTYTDQGIIIRFVPQNGQTKTDKICNELNTISLTCKNMIDENNLSKIRGSVMGTININLVLRADAPVGKFAFIGDKNAVWYHEGISETDKVEGLLVGARSARDFSIIGEVVNNPNLTTCNEGLYYNQQNNLCLTNKTTINPINILEKNSSGKLMISGTCVPLGDLELKFQTQTLSTTCDNNGNYTLDVDSNSPELYKDVSIISTQDGQTIETNVKNNLFVPKCNNGATNPTDCDQCSSDNKLIDYKCKKNLSIFGLGQTGVVVMLICLFCLLFIIVFGILWWFWKRHTAKLVNTKD
jgi:hypothetical protein